MMAKLDEGIIVGTSQRQEWLLPWWWMHFRTHNEHSVTFVDFGDLSAQAINWCSKRGQVVQLHLSDAFMKQKKEIDPSLVSLWENIQPNVWVLRFTWYKKPFALALTPYKKTLWLDLDCQVRGSIQQMFEFCENEGGFAVAREHQLSQNLNLHRKVIAQGETMYNAGVIVYKNDSPVLQKWKDSTLR